MRDKIIEVEGLEKRYGSVQAVRGITFGVERGSLFSWRKRSGEEYDDQYFVFDSSKGCGESSHLRL